MSKIKIKCDMCGNEHDVEEVMQVEFDPKVKQQLWLTEPHLTGEHFICCDCLVKVGWRYMDDETETTSNEGDDKHE